MSRTPLWELFRQDFVIPGLQHGFAAGARHAVGTSIHFGRPQVLLPQKTPDTIKSPICATAKPFDGYLIAGLMGHFCYRLKAVPQLADKLPVPIFFRALANL